MNEKKRTIALGANTSQYVWSTRSELIKVLIERGYHVVVLAPRDQFSQKFSAIGAEYIEIPMSMNTNPVSDFGIFLKFLNAMRQSKPDAYLGFTVKPNVYGSLAANVLNIPVINNIAGLGAPFVTRSAITRIVKQLYRAGLAKSALVFFQNRDDHALFRDEKILRHDRTDILPGSGVDLTRFKYTPRVQNDPHTPFRFLLVSRMLWDKGIGEYADAARDIKTRHPNTEVYLLGSMGIDNPASIPSKTIQRWVKEGIVSYLDFKEDVIPEIIAADCVVLPSYREGTPRTLLEACAIGRPIITADAVGCRDVVDDAVNGFMCAPKDSRDLAQKMEQMILLGPDARIEMGRQGRLKMEAQYDERTVIGKYLDTLKQTLQG
ncbi:glycosyltransferase family 4 protein [Tropicibacter sp. Alg240-R139]|uniref:glycosyltransferase family 4 protein n=1 Tax=Tropicibacter sp. Alg240-R139 TaxID=2305991 RepID=UPI0013E0CC4C|nr:glycosyltransferase family 4 protein [Tropicibacter sp. Alg240-R139]